MTYRESLKSSNRGSDALCQAFFELLEEEQLRSQRTMEAAGRRNAALAAVDDLVTRVFLGVGRRTLEILGERSDRVR